MKKMISYHARKRFVTLKKSTEELLASFMSTFFRMRVKI